MLYVLFQSWKRPYFFILQLFQEGKLTGTKVALLKAKYTELHETLKKWVENNSI